MLCLEFELDIWQQFPVSDETYLATKLTTLCTKFLLIFCCRLLHYGDTVQLYFHTWITPSSMTNRNPVKLKLSKVNFVTNVFHSTANKYRNELEEQNRGGGGGEETWVRNSVPLTKLRISTCYFILYRRPLSATQWNNFLIIKRTRCTNFSNLFLERNSTCFGQFLCPSSGVFQCTHSSGICHTGLLTACEQDQDGTAKQFHPDPAHKLYDIYHCCVCSEKLLVMDRGTVRNM